MFPYCNAELTDVERDAAAGILSLRLYVRTQVAAALRYLASSVRGLTELELLDLLSCNDDAVAAAMTYDFTDDTKPSQSRQLCRFPHQLWYDLRQELGM